MKNIYDFFLPIYQKYSLKTICDKLSVHKGTVNRWIEKKEVPPQYYFDLCRIDNIEVDYSRFSEVEKDQFFTHPESAKYCYKKALEIISNFEDDINKYSFIEPSAGDGSFYNLLPKDNRIGVDIEPRCEGIIKADYLMWEPKTENNIVIGNPPFGLRGNLALKFINHSFKFSDYVCFILPQLFESDGKGSCKNRVNGFNLIHSEIIKSDFYYPDKTTTNVNVVFQIWSKHHKIESEEIDLTGIIKLYSLSDGGTPSTIRNKKHLYSCDYYLPSTCFGSNKMKLYDNFEDLPQRRGYGIVVEYNKSVIGEIIKNINWFDVAFTSTNGAKNLRFNLIQKTIWNHLPQQYKQKNNIESYMKNT